jgi:hypothetical protein
MNILFLFTINKINYIKPDFGICYIITSKFPRYKSKEDLKQDAENNYFRIVFPIE